MQAINNARQIGICLQNYAADHGDHYPDSDSPEAKHSNDVFRHLFKVGIMEDEKVFTAASSPFEGDNNIGEGPDYTEALAAGENHWAMTKGLTPKSAGAIPLIFENPVLDTWPPCWDTTRAGTKAEGRAWKTGTIIICRNDGSASAEKLTDRTGPNTPLKPDSDGKDLFTRWLTAGSYLNVQR
jgi:hypothetical protein